VSSKSIQDQSATLTEKKLLRKINNPGENKAKFLFLRSTWNCLLNYVSHLAAFKYITDKNGSAILVFILSAKKTKPHF
jgi:hypothetical protein